MIRASSTLAFTALLVSGALHLSGVSLLSRVEDVQIEGGSPGNVARLGNSFQDVATGVQAPATPTETQVPEETQTQADRAEPSPQVDRDVPDEAQAAQSTVSATPPLPPTATALASTAPMPTSTPLTPTALTPSPLTATTLMPAAPQVVAALEPNPSSTQPASQTALTPVPPETISPPPQPDTLEALDTPPTPEASPSASLRPKPRPKPPKRTARAPVTPPAATPSRQSQPSQRAGRSDGQRDAVQTETTDSTKRAAQAGNADVSNYPGKVQRKISKVRRPRLSGSGTAEVVFRIAASGGLADLRIARSSGNARMDQEALSIIQRAAPFPKPPAGARVTYRVPVNWR